MKPTPSHFARTSVFFFGCVALAAVSAPVSAPAQDSAPVVLSRVEVGAGGWTTPAELIAAANRGNPRARARLGEKLLTGDEIPADIPRALVLLEQSARAGVSSAAFRLGMLLDDGQVVARDRLRALGYFRAAAAGGEAEAFYNVGVAYAGAHGVKRDYVEGLAWLILATKHGADASGEQAVRERLTKTNRTELIMAAETRAPVLAAELARTSATSQLPPAAPLTWLGTTTAPEAGDTPDAPPVKVVAAVRVVLPVSHYREWSTLTELESSAAQQDLGAMAALGQVLLDGQLTPTDLPRAQTLLERAASAGSADAAQLLADLYTKADRVSRDDAKAFAYTLQAARGGYPLAMFNLGAFYANGRGTARDFTAALAWLIVAKHYQLQTGAAESRIRGYLERNAPAEITLAEKQAAAFVQEITAASARPAHS